jgi:hypothetical protein
VVGTNLAPSGTTGTFAILEASAGSLTNNGLTVQDAATVTYGLFQATGGIPTTSLRYTIDFTPEVGLTPIQSSFGDYVDELIAARLAEIESGGNHLAFVEDLTRYLLNVRDVDTLVDIYGRFAPIGIFAPADAALFSSFDFADKLNSCPDTKATGMAVFTRDGSCLWAGMGRAATRGEINGSAIGYDEDVFRLDGGFQAELRDGVFAGFALGLESGTLSAGTPEGDGQRFHVGVVGKREFGNSTIAASLSGGFSDYDLVHGISAPSGTIAAEAEPHTSWLSAHARLSHVFDLTDTTYVKPWVDVGVDQQWQDAFTVGTGKFGLDVESTQSTFVTVNPMIELGGVFDLMGMSTEAKLRAGALAIVSGDGWAAEAALAGFSGGPTFQIAGDVNSLSAQVGANFETRISDKASLQSGVDSLLASDRQAYSGSIRLNVAF